MKLTFVLTIDDTNALLTALGQLPYVQSVRLIDMIQNQATPQIVAANNAANTEPVPEVLNG